MKYVVLSFDDGRLDTYTNAMPVMKQYGITATINVSSDFVEHPENYDCFESGGNKAMTIKQVLDMQEDGFEIACHGHTHKNNKEDIVKNIDCFAGWGVCVDNIGLASPGSYITKSNINEICGLIDEGVIGYIRSGIQVRREGWLYVFLYILEQLTHCKKLFWLLNRKALVSVVNDSFLLGVAVTKNTTIDQVKYFIDKMQDGTGIIFVFHSILKDCDKNQKVDKYYWEDERLEKLCKYITDCPNITTVSTKSLLEKIL